MKIFEIYLDLFILFLIINKKYKDMKNIIKFKALMALRRFGLISQPSEPLKQGIRVAKTVYPTDVETQTMTPIETAVYIYLENKKASAKNCQFDTESQTCVCGITVNKFGEKGCPNRSQIKSK
jgi:hypothetical protein